MRIGILGGTFNPIHIGHLILAEQTHDILNLSKIIFIPSFISPHKEVEDNVSAKHRYEMVKLAISDSEKFEVSSIEIAEEEKSYTVSTLEKLKLRYPSDSLFFIAGSDALYEEWKDFSRILELSKFVVVKRSGYPIKDNLDKEIQVFEMSLVDISSSKIRAMLAEGGSIRYLLSDEVIKYINKNSLY